MTDWEGVPDDIEETSDLARVGHAPAERVAQLEDERRELAEACYFDADEPMTLRGAIRHMLLDIYGHLEDGDLDGAIQRIAVTDFDVVPTAPDAKGRNHE